MSLQDGLILYKMDFKNTVAISAECFAEVVEHVEPVLWFYPHHSVKEETCYCDSEYIEVDYSDKYKHIIHFLNGIQNIMFMQTEYKLDIGNYLTDDAIELRNQ